MYPPPQISLSQVVKHDDVKGPHRSIRTGRRITLDELMSGLEEPYAIPSTSLCPSRIVATFTEISGRELGLPPG